MAAPDRAAASPISLLQQRGRPHMDPDRETAGARRTRFASHTPVTAANRFDTIRKSDADLLCEARSITLSRRKLVDFSIPIFVDGAGIVTTATDLARRKVGVVAGTTT